MVKLALYFTPKTKARIFTMLLLFIAAGSLFYWQFTKLSSKPVIFSMPLQGKVIAVDPGHGGYDPGIKIGEVLEKEVNLAVSLALRDYLQQGGARVVMTREKDMDLLQPTAGPKKKLEMKNRLKVIEECGAHLILSIHSNAISSSYWSGAQTFYQHGDEEGKLLAEYIQAELIRVLQNTDRKINPGDYVLLRESSMPGAVVEVGFLSNPAEARLLVTPEYQRKVAWSIYGGVVRYFESN